MIKLGRVSIRTRGLFQIDNYVEDYVACAPGNVKPRTSTNCPI